ncbi:MAG: hypothetical protein AAFO69_15955 [Bacteroidota bacterium]
MSNKQKHQTAIPLEPEDLKKLRKQLIPVLIFPFLAGGVFFLIFTFVFKNKTDGLAADGIVLWVMIAFALFFAGILGYMIWSFVYDIRQGIKHRITGVVTDKQMDVQTSQKSTGRHGSSTRTTRSYYVFIDQIRYKMDYSAYGKVKVGDHIELEKAPKSGVTLKLEVLTPAETQETRNEEAVGRSFLNTKLEPVPLTEADIKHLKKQYFQFVQKRVLWNLPLIMIVGSLVASGLQGLLLFLFPIPIILGYAFFRIIRATSRYFRNKSEGHKFGVTAMVEDKITVTGNRTSTQYKIKSTAGTFPTNQSLYEKLSKNDKLVVFKPMFGITMLSVTTMDQQEFYV